MVTVITGITVKIVAAGAGAAAAAGAFVEIAVQLNHACLHDPDRRRLPAGGGIVAVDGRHHVVQPATNWIY